MRYLCLCYREAPRDPAGTPAMAVEAADGVLAAATFAPDDGVATLRVRNGTLVVDEGAPGTGTLDAVALIEARDLNQAIRLASALPAAAIGRVEVRAASPGARLS